MGSHDVDCPPRRDYPKNDSEGSNREWYVLSMLTGNAQWKSLSIHAKDDLEARVDAFISEHRLNTAFRAGMARQLRWMLATRQREAAVDIVDLL